MYRYIKRFLDIILSLSLIIVILPLLLLLAAMVRYSLGSPVFFRQRRSTKGGRVFSIYKFRTMTDACDEDGKPLPDEQRKTPFGVWLRGTSLDELPQVINILNGDMSIIGPRPLFPEYHDYYTEQEKKRYLVRGGLLTVGVLKGNPLPSWDEQLQWEAEYAEHPTFATDVKILIKSLAFVLDRKNTGYGDYVRKTLIEERTKR